MVSNHNCQRHKSGFRTTWNEFCFHLVYIERWLKAKIIILESHVRDNGVSLLCGFELLKGVVCLLCFFPNVAGTDAKEPGQLQGLLGRGDHMFLLF